MTIMLTKRFYKILFIPFSRQTKMHTNNIVIRLRILPPERSEVSSNITTSVRLKIANASHRPCSKCFQPTKAAM